MLPHWFIKSNNSLYDLLYGMERRNLQPSNRPDLPSTLPSPNFLSLLNLDDQLSFYTPSSTHGFSKRHQWQEREGNICRE